MERYNLVECSNIFNASRSRVGHGSTQIVALQVLEIRDYDLAARKVMVGAAWGRGAQTVFEAFGNATIMGGTMTTRRFEALNMFEHFHQVVSFHQVDWMPALGQTKL